MSGGVRHQRADEHTELSERTSYGLHVLWVRGPEVSRILVSTNEPCHREFSNARRESVPSYNVIVFW